MENPITSIGEAAKTGGSLVADFSYGIVGHLTKLTGDGYTAAVFGVFLLFTLSLLRGAASSRNSPLYSGGLVILGGGGLLVIAVLALLSQYQDFMSLFQPNADRDFLYKGLTSIEYKDEVKFRFIVYAIPSLFAPYKWYAAVFLNILLVGVFLGLISLLMTKLRGSPQGTAT